MFQMRKPIALLGLAALTAVAAPALAQDMFFVGPRALGMAGSTVASVNDTTAMYYNPAAFGFFALRDEQGERLDCDNNDCGRKVWGLDLDAGAGYRLHQQFGTFLDELADIDFESLGQNGLQNDPERLAELVRLTTNLAGIDDPGNAMTADINGGLGARIGHFGVGVRAYVQGTGRVVTLDTVNLGLTTAGGNLQTDINNVTVPNFNPAGYQFVVFNPAQVDQLRVALGDPTLSDPDSLEAAQKLDFLAQQEGIDPARVQETTDILTNVATGSDAGTKLEDNETTVFLTGFGLLEIPVSYGYAINDHWAVGTSVKFMLGRVYGSRIIVFDDDAQDLIKELDDDYEESANFGVDLSLMGRYKYVQFGLIGRNLNAPKFDGFSSSKTLTNGRIVDVDVDDVTVDPQVRAGVAFIPHPTLTLEFDYDLTENDTTFDEYSTQYASVGLEWDAFRVLALRAGAYKNVADSDIDWVYTAGLGLNLWAARLDLAGAFTTDKEEFDDDEIPREIRAAAQLSVDF